MEGKGSVAFTIDMAIACAAIHRPVTVALQAYLNRTQADLETVVSHGIGVRLVKGAYLGDIQNFREIQDRMRAVAEDMLLREKPFSFATQDPDLIAWLLERLGGKRDAVEFGFIMGLSDQTKVGLATDGWKVSEYVPFGPGGSAYILRRERYLRDLQVLGRTPAP
jgi:proline dehydrogenase